MKKKIVVTIGIIALFVGASVVSGINRNGELFYVIDEFGNLNRDTETFYPTDDVYIDMNNPNNNQGSDVDLKISNRYGATPDWERDLLFKFDISSIPSGTIIDSATLNIFYYQYLDTNPAGRELTLYRITSNWNEDSVTWNNRPNLAAEITSSSFVPGFPGVWMEWEVTTDVQDFIDGVETNYGWEILDETYWGGPDLPTSKFHSKEYGNYIPYLEIEIIENQPPGAPQINGKTSGKAGQIYAYTFVSVDPDDDDIFYEVDWGDGTIDPWDGPYESNELISKDHVWSEQGDYTIKARAKDVNEEIGEWGTLEVTMPMNQYSHNWWFLQFLQKHPQTFPILRHILGL